MTAPAWEVPDRGISRGDADRRFGARGASVALALLLGAGLALRVLIAYRLPGSGFEVDLNAFRYWAGNLADQGPFGFYDRPFFHDYTPGYLYFLWVVGIVGHALGGIGDLIKAPAILADIALGYLVYRLVMDLTSNAGRALLAAGLVVFNPITWFDSVVWGQVDSVGLVFLLLGLRDLWHDHPERAALWATVAAVIKPQLGILVPIVAVVVIRQALMGRARDEAGLDPAGELDRVVGAAGPGDEVAERSPAGEGGGPTADAPDDADAGLEKRWRAWRRDPRVRVLTTAATGLLTAIVLSAPFGLSLPALLGQVAETAGGYPWLTVNAYNPWALVSHEGDGLAVNGSWLCDAITTNAAGSSANTPCQPGSETLIGPLWAVAVGGLLLLAAAVVALAIVARHPDRRTILVGLVVLAVAFFVLPTRVHERYLFPFVALGAVLAAISLRWRAAYVVVSATVFLNMYVVLTTLYPDNPGIKDWLGIGGGIRSSVGVGLIALVNGLAFLWVLAQLRPSARRALARATEEAIEEARDADAEDAEAAAGAAPDLGDGVGVGGRAVAGGGLRGAAAGGGAYAALASDEEPPGIQAWVRGRLTQPSVRPDRSRTLEGEPGGRFDRLDVWVVAVLVIASLVLRTWRLAEPYQMHFDEVYHARTATEFLQKWRYGIDHDIYEWTHPHVAKYAMAAGLVLFGDDRVTGTSSLNVPVLDATIEPARDDPAFGRAGDRLYVATGQDVRAYDLTTRRLVARITGSAATAVAWDAGASRLYVGAADGSVRALATAVTLDGAPANGPPAEVATTPLASVTGGVSRLLASGDGSWVAATSGDSITLVDPETGKVTGHAPVAGLGQLTTAGNGDALVGRPSEIADPSAAAKTLARIFGGSAKTYAPQLATDADQVTIAAAVTKSNRAAVDAAIADRSLAGFTVEQQPRLVAAGRSGLTFLSPSTGKVLDEVTTDDPATGLAYVGNLDTPRLYVATGKAVTVVTLGENGAETPKVDSRIVMPGSVVTTFWDPATLMVHALGRTPGGDASTVYVIEPHGNAVYADAKLPFDPAATALDVAPDFPSSDRQQLIALGAHGETATVDVGKNAFAWRLPGVLAGALTTALIYILGRLLFRRRSVALLAAFLVLADGMFFVMARIGMNDAYVGVFLVAAYALFTAMWQRRGPARVAFWLGMPVLGVLLGLALASKWVAAYAIGALGILILVRSALGRVVLIAGLIGVTTALGYLAIGVPSAAASGPNLTFMLIMVGLTGVAVAAAVLHPIAWSREEVRLAIGAPIVVGAAVVVLALARGLPVIHVGSLSVPVVVLGLAAAAVGPLAWLAFRAAGSIGFGPNATAPADDTSAGGAVAAAAPPAGWLLPGRAFGLPVVWAAVCLLAIPLGVYILSYLPWAGIDGHQIVAGFPAGHTGQTLVDLTKQMYDYHNNLRTGHAASSPWWAWPLDLKPVWFYQGSFADSTAGSIYDAGNIVIWWLAIAALGFVAYQAFRRRSVALALIAIGFACQWLAWARIDRATFQYHYYTSLPFVVLALGYLLAELWHGPSARTWLLARLAAAAVIVGPMAMWLFKAPLCAFVGVDRASPGSLACQGNPGNLVITPQTAGLTLVVVIAVVLVIRELLAAGRSPAEAERSPVVGAVDGEADDGAFEDVATARGGALGGRLPRIIAIAVVAGIGLAATTVLDATDPIFSLQGFRPELAAILLLVPLAAVAWVVATARDPRRFTIGAVAGIAGWFVVLYPNIAALPLPTSLVNAYQGLLPTYLYPFQFPVNTDPVPPPVRLFAVGPLLVFAGLVVFCLVLAYAAWVWRLQIVEQERDSGDEAGAPPVPPAGGSLAPSGSRGSP